MPNVLVCSLCYATAAAAAEDDTCESIIFHLALLVFVFKALFFPLVAVADRRCCYFVRVFCFHCYFRFPFRLAKNLAFNY